MALISIASFSGLDMAVNTLSGVKKNMSSEVLKEYWDTMARLQKWLTLNKGVKSIGFSNKRVERNFK